MQRTYCIRYSNLVAYSWVRTFIEARGLQVITNVLGNLNKRQIK